MSNIGKTLKDYNPTPSALQGGQMFQLDDGSPPNNYQLDQSGPFDAVRSTSSDDSPPNTEPIPNNLWPTLTGNSTRGYKLAMTLGHVDARKYVGDAALPIEITNIPGQPSRIDNALDVEIGDKIYCEILENQRGEATAAAIKKGSSWPTSTAAALLGGNSAGVEGKRNVHLCEIVAEESGIAKVEVYHSGSISHFQPELVENTGTPAGPGLAARLLKIWDIATGQWKLRILSKGFGQLSITENSDDVVVRGTKKDSDVKVFYGATPMSDFLLSFRDGLETTGNEVNGDEDPVVDPKEQVIQIPQVLADDGELVVTSVAGAVLGVRTYNIRGNSNDATFSISVNGGSEQTLLTCVDGLVPDESKNIDITIPEGEGLEPGDAIGDMLYWTGVAWDLIPHPGADETDSKWVLHANSEVEGVSSPGWFSYKEIPVDICVSGASTSYTILGTLT